jgi:alkanesulfonate monooxygenase SsuD/methylene tetrahydromethanopterin reductase-like flavin-dependent oxidoreductase (luciferase family)
MSIPVRFGYCLPLFAAPGLPLFRTPNYESLDPVRTLDLARRADTLGYDSLWVADHLMLGRDEAILEGWTTLAALAGATQRARLGMIHHANLLRHPSVAAKAAATLDQLSGGRLIHFFDGGNNAREHQAYGLPWDDDPAGRLARMQEALELTLDLWTSQAPVDHHGHYYRLDQAVCRPQPQQQPHPPVWLGEAHPTMLDLCARRAQGWNTTPVTLEELDRRLDALKAACHSADRPFSELEISLETQILIAPDRHSLRQRLQDMAAKGPTAAAPDIHSFLQSTSDEIPPSLAGPHLIGTADEICLKLQAYIDRGVNHFMLWFMDAPETDDLIEFATNIAPRFR